MNVNITTNVQLQFINLRDKHYTFRETYCQKMEIKPNIDKLKDMIEQQLNLTDDTFAFVKCMIDKLNDMGLELNVMKVDLNNMKGMFC